jgi:hypothetical protein
MKKEKLQKIIIGLISSNKINRHAVKRLDKTSILAIIRNTKEFPSYFSLNERIYILYNSISISDIICPICKKGYRKFINFRKGYSLGCSGRCSLNHPATIIKRKETCMKRYGVESSNQSSAIKEKKKKTLSIDYEIKMKNKRDKWKETLLNNNPDKTLKDIYREQGIKAIKKSKEADPGLKNRLIKTKKTNMEKYGKEFASQTEWFKEEVRRTNIENRDWEQLLPKEHKTWEDYTKEVRRWTLRNVRKYSHFITGEYCNKMQLDHALSIYDGYYNNISPYFISHIQNLRYITKEENLHKWKHSIIDYTTLLRRIISFKLPDNDKYLYLVKTGALMELSIYGNNRNNIENKNKIVFNKSI